MIYKIISIYLLLVSFLYSNTFDELKIKTLKNNQSLKVLENDIKISTQNGYLSVKYKNPIVGFGMNDILLSDITNRSKEPMQTQFITLSQTVPLGNKLEIKKSLFKIQKEIEKLFLKDKKIKYNSIILSNLNEYIILEEKINTLEELIKNINKIILLQKQKFKISNIEQISIINNQDKILNIKLNIQNLYNKLEIIKLQLQNISYTKINKIKHTLSSMQISDIKTKELLEKNNIYKVLKKKVIKNEKNISYENSLKTSDIKINFGYYQRENFDDYLAFSLAYPLSIYGSEDIKVKKAKVQKVKSNIVLKEFENEFNIKIKTILTNMKLSKIKYDLIVSQIIKHNNLIDKLLKSKSIQNKVNTISQIKNQNDILQNKIKALDEKMKFYKNKALLEYYKGTSL